MTAKSGYDANTQEQEEEKELPSTVTVLVRPEQSRLLARLEAEGHVERYIFGFEESYGYLSGGHVRDKDAVNATLLVCEAAAWYAQQGMTLLDAIEALYKEFGYYRNALCSFAFEGETGMYTMQNLMKALRADPPKEIAGYAVEACCGL